MKRITLFLILFFASFFQIFGQEFTTCPTIKVMSPTRKIFAGENLLFSVSLIGKFDNSKFEYRWTISTGKILDGQGTTAILASTGKEVNIYEISAKVEINGLPANCQRIYSSEIETIELSRTTEPFENYKKLKWVDEWNRLERLRLELSLDSKTETVLIFSIAKDSELDLVYLRQKKILKFLRDNKISQTRVRMVVERGYSYQTTVWIIYN